MRWMDRYRQAVLRAGSLAAVALGNGNTAGFAAKLPADDPAYAERVARPVMAAVDEMPPEWRRLVHEHGYVDVYRAWRRGVPPTLVAASAAANGGVFELR